VEYCVFTEPQQGFSYDDQRVFAQAAERLGFDGYFRSDHYLRMGPGDPLPGPTDAWTTLAGLARETTRIRLGTLVSSATHRLPAVLAIQVAQVDAMSDGRIELGLGTGWFEEEHRAYGIPFPPKRFGILEEQLAVITGLWRTPVGETFSFAGEHYTLDGAPALPKPVQSSVPVIVGGAATYTAALHLMRTGAAGVLVGFGGGAASTTRATLGLHAPMATAVADVAGARRDYLDESGGRYVHVIADGGVGTSGDIVKALAMGADAVMLGVALARATDAPGRGFHWGPEAHHPKLPRGHRVAVDRVGPLEQILYGPAPVADGTANLVGALKKSMATTGYSDLKEFQRVEVVVAPYGH